MKDNNDNLDLLFLAVYGRKPTFLEYLEGSDAKILLDAANLISELRKKPDGARYGGICSECGRDYYFDEKGNLL